MFQVGMVATSIACILVEVKFGYLKALLGCPLSELPRFVQFYL